MPDGSSPLGVADAKPLTPREPGIVFGLPAEDYHKDPSLSATDIKRILIHPAHFWQQSWMNPDRVDDSDTPAKKQGRALHKLVLEGPDAFAKAFIAEPNPADHPGCLVTLEDLKGFCRDKGEKVSGTKAELAKIVKARDASITIWDDVLALFKSMVERDQLEVLKPEAMAEVKKAAESITLNPHLAKAFRGGAPEVSVFWVDEHGIPCKCRPDFLKPRTIVDLKKFANQRERPVDVAVRLALAEYRYDIPARHYLNGYRYLYEFAREGRIFGDCPLPKGWETQIAEPDEMRWIWVFHQLEAPVTIGRQITTDSPVLNRATRDIATAKATYLKCLEKFGTGMWVSDEPIADLEETDLPAWMREDVEVL